MIHECLGRGGFGEVYRATMVSPGGLDTEVAVKVLRLDLDPNSDAVSRLRDEGRLLAALRHPAILKAHDLALLDGRVALVTEFVHGADLHHCITGEDKLTARAAVEVIETVADALDAAWNRSIDGGEPLRLVHRDIKPSNIRLGSHGEVKLLDFGIARSDEVDREARTGTGSTVGSLAYMAPERFTRAAPGPEADVYALGCTLYEAIAGARLHHDPVPVEMFRLAATAEAHDRHVEKALAAVPEDAGAVLELLRAMLAHDKQVRPTANDVAQACDALSEGLPGASLKRWARQRSWANLSSIQGSFDGRTITEGTLSGHIISQEMPRTDTASDTFQFNDAFENAPTEDAVPSGAAGASDVPPTVSTVVPLPSAAPPVSAPQGTVLTPLYIGAAVVALALAIGAGIVFGGYGSLSISADADGVDMQGKVGDREMDAQLGNPLESVAPRTRVQGAQTVRRSKVSAGAPVAPASPDKVGTGLGKEPAPAPPPAPPAKPAPQPEPPAPAPAPSTTSKAPKPPPAPKVATPAPVVAPQPPMPPEAPAPAPEPAVEKARVTKKATSAGAKALKLQIVQGDAVYDVGADGAMVPEGTYGIKVNGILTKERIEVRNGVYNQIECNGSTATCSSN